MPEVTFSIGQRAYTLVCAAGQEERLRAMAAELNRRIARLSRRAAVSDERQLLVAAAIELLDALGDAEKANVEKASAEKAAVQAWAQSMAERLDAVDAALDELVPADKSP